jgi:hypothetical protein
MEDDDYDDDAYDDNDYNDNNYDTTTIDKLVEECDYELHLSVSSQILQYPW